MGTASESTYLVYNVTCCAGELHGGAFASHKCPWLSAGHSRTSRSCCVQNLVVVVLLSGLRWDTARPRCCKYQVLVPSGATISAGMG
jgi:hypothetical protein